MKTKENQITVYWPGSFFGAIHKTEGTMIEHGTHPYAQYKNVPFVKLVPVGKRKPVMIQKDYKPYLLILDGVGHPDPEGMFVEKADASAFDRERGISSPMVEIKTSKYSSFDDRWETDFDQIIDKHIAESKPVVIADYRHTKGFSS